MYFNNKIKRITLQISMRPFLFFFNNVKHVFNPQRDSYLIKDWKEIRYMQNIFCCQRRSRLSFFPLYWV